MKRREISRKIMLVFAVGIIMTASLFTVLLQTVQGEEGSGNTRLSNVVEREYCDPPEIGPGRISFSNVPDRGYYHLGEEFEITVECRSNLEECYPYKAKLYTPSGSKREEWSFDSKGTYTVTYSNTNQYGFWSAELWYNPPDGRGTPKCKSENRSAPNPTSQNSEKTLETLAPFQSEGRDPPEIAFGLRRIGLAYAEVSQDQDRDHDGLDDGEENRLLQKYAPLVLLHPNDDYRPCNVDWFLNHVLLRFNHWNGCGDCPPEDDKSLDDWDDNRRYPRRSQSKLIDMRHDKKSGWPECKHNDDSERSWIDWSGDHHFFLQIPNNEFEEEIRRGIPSERSTEWKVYGHVYPNIFGGINIQYWFFYAYNDFNVWPLQFSHEGDWEHILVELASDERVLNVIFYAHDGGECEDNQIVSPIYVTWYGETHPVVISAKGSHASYYRYDHCTGHSCYGVGERGCYWCEPPEDSPYAWFTWDDGKPNGKPGFQGGGVINVGERLYEGGPNQEIPKGYLNSQKFIHFSGRWGEIGESTVTSGPRGPAYQDSWNFERG